MAKAVDIEAALARLPVLHGRTPETANDEADKSFATLAAFGDGGVFAGSFDGTSEWERHAQGDELVMLAEDAGKGIVGLSSGGRARGPHGCKAEIFTLYVLPDEQGRGVGRALLAGMFAEFVDQSLESVIIWVLAANPARFFYETTGGKRSAEREERLWGSDLPEIAYIWRDLADALEGDLRVRR